MAILKDTTINGNLNVHGNIFEKNTLVEPLTQSSFTCEYMAVTYYTQSTGEFYFADMPVSGNTDLGGLYILEFLGCQIFFVINNPVLSQSYTISGVIARADSNYAADVQTYSLAYTVVPGSSLAYDLKVSGGSSFIPNNTQAYLYRIRTY